MPSKTLVAAFVISIISAAIFEAGAPDRSPVSGVDQATPIPQYSPGFSIGSLLPTSSRLDLFVDPHCIDSKELFAKFARLLDATIDGKKVRDSIEVYLHYIALPYHTYSFSAIVALKYLEAKYPKGVLPFLDKMFDKLDQFNRGFGGSTPKAVRYIIQGYVKEVLPADFPYPSDVFTGAYLDAARIAFKYAMSRGVTGAPFLHINWVNVDDVPEQYQDLATLVTPFLH